MLLELMHVGLVNSKSFWFNQAWTTLSWSAVISLVPLFIEELRRCPGRVERFYRRNSVRRQTG